MTQVTLKRLSFIHSPDAFLAETQQYGAMFMPVWAYTLAAYVEEPESYEMRLYDMRFDDVEAVPAADLFVFSGVNQDYESIVATHARLRERHPTATFVIGGPITWSLNQAGEVSKLEMFDHVLIGDGEESFPRFVKNFSGRARLPKVVENKVRFDVTRARGFYGRFLSVTYTLDYDVALQ